MQKIVRTRFSRKFSTLTFITSAAGVRIDIRSPAFEQTTTTTTADDADTISEALSDNKFLETSL
jgi:hypothetical protein